MEIEGVHIALRDTLASLVAPPHGPPTAVEEVIIAAIRKVEAFNSQLLAKVRERSQFSVPKATRGTGPHKHKHMHMHSSPDLSLANWVARTEDRAETQNLAGGRSRGPGLSRSHSAASDALGHQQCSNGVAPAARRRSAHRRKAELVALVEATAEDAACEHGRRQQVTPRPLKPTSPSPSL